MRCITNMKKPSGEGCYACFDTRPVSRRCAPFTYFLALHSFDLSADAVRVPALRRSDELGGIDNRSRLFYPVTLTKWQ